MAYERLFTVKCSNCQRVISAEGHVPPVVRRRLPQADGKGPQWDARHVVCKYEPPPPPPAADEPGAEPAPDATGDGGGGGGGRCWAGRGAAGLFGSGRCGWRDGTRGVLVI